MKILIIEDEPQTAAILKDMIEQIQPGFQVVAIIESIDKSVRYLSLKENQPELIFMDIQLADGLCFEIFKQVQINCPVVFCTAYDQYTLQAFKTNGIDYILKPAKEDDIRSTFLKIDKLKHAFNRSNDDIVNIFKNALIETKSYKSSILVRFRESYIPLETNNIVLFFLENEIVYAYCFDNQKYAVFKPLEEIEKELNPSHFYRINRQVLLNHKAIKEIQPYFNRKVVIKTPTNFNEQLIVSRLKVSDFMKWVERH